MSGPVKRRSYDNSRREEGARQTRLSIVAAAQELFVENGYPATTFPAIAERAGVSVQTVFAHFPTKRDLLKEVIDQAVVGDDEPVPVRDRPEVAAIMAEPDPTAKASPACGPRSRDLTAGHLGRPDAAECRSR